MLTMLSQNYISINYKRLLLGIGTVLLLLNCTQKQEVTPTIESDVLNVKVTDPVYRDFDDIQRTGVLRMITSYSSGSYFLYRGIQVGFEYELVKEFARQNNLAVEVIIPTEDENPYDLLNSGAGDIIAASYTITDERKKDR